MSSFVKEVIQRATPEQEAGLNISGIQAQLGFLQGKVLTIIDAVVSGPQNKPTKDLVKAAFNEQSNYIMDLVYGLPQTVQSTSGKK